MDERPRAGTALWFLCGWLLIVATLAWRDRAAPPAAPWACTPGGSGGGVAGAGPEPPGQLAPVDPRPLRALVDIGPHRARAVADAAWERALDLAAPGAAVALAEAPGIGPTTAARVTDWARSAQAQATRGGTLQDGSVHFPPTSTRPCPRLPPTPTRLPRAPSPLPAGGCPPP